MCRFDVYNVNSSVEEAANVIQSDSQSWPPLSELLAGKSKASTVPKHRKNKWQEKEARWLVDVQSSAERARRVCTLWKVCECLMNVAPSQRPRTAASFERFVRKSCVVRSFSCDPASIAFALGAPDVGDFLSKAKRPIPQQFLEPVSAEILARAKRGWTRLSGNMSLGALARFLTSQAYVQRTYRAQDVLETLSICGVALLDQGPMIDFSALTLKMCRECLPSLAKNRNLWNSWNVFARKTQAMCVVPMALDLVPHIIGKQGAAFKTLEGDIAQAAKVEVRSADSTCRMYVETVEEEIERRTFREEGKNVVQIREKVLIKEARIRLQVSCVETIVGVAPLAKPAQTVLAAASRKIRTHVNECKARQLKRVRPPRIMQKKQPVFKAEDIWLEEYTSMKLRNESAKQTSDGKLRQWRSNKHYRRPPPCWCRYQWRGGRHKVNGIPTDEYL